MLAIECRVLGSRRPAVDGWSVEPPRECADGGRTTLRRLIECAVRAEVAAFDERASERRFLRALTEREIAAGAAAGKIASGGQVSTPAAVDAETAVAVALQAFEDGLYRVIVDGVEARELDGALFLASDSKATFLRLTLLAGG